MLLVEFKTLHEGKEDRTFYHMTLARNVNKVLSDGLIPRRGPRSRKMKEGDAAIYLFPTIKDAELAYTSWLGNEFADETKLALLKVTVPHTMEIHSDAPYECHVYEPIPPSCISVQSADAGGEIGFDHLA